MAKIKGICRNEECDHCDEIMEAEKSNFVCEYCQKPLFPMSANTTGDGGGGGVNPKLIGIIAAAVIVLAGAGFGIWKLVGGKKPTAINLDKDKLEMVVGDKDLIVPKAEPEGTKATFNFTITDGTAVEVTSGGEVTATEPGEAVVTVKCEENDELSATCKITVKTKEVPVAPQEPQVQEPEAKEDSVAPPVKDKKHVEPTEPKPERSSNGTINLGYGIYEGHVSGGKANGIGGEIRFTRSYTIDLKKASGETVEVEAGDRMINVKMKDNRIIQGLLKRQDGSQRMIIIG